MRTFIQYISIICLLMLNILNISAQEIDSLDVQEEERDSIRASLITCTPGTDAYAHFGHTALRITNFTNGKDIIFNYGCFDSSQGDFIMKFIKGETDYVVNAEEEDYFLFRYDKLGHGVSEQVLNLTQDEALNLAELLIINVQPENRGYRYNWLYDNCTTRARDMISKAVNGTIIYENTLSQKTPRNQLHECLANDSWLKLGIDLLLGTEIDTLAPRNIQQFIPAYYENDLNNAYIISPDGSKRRMVASQNPLLDEKDFNKVGDTPFTPLVAFGILFVVTVAISIYDYKRKKMSYWYDAILHISQGCAGIIIAYLFFFSLHPAVDSNWQVIIFNPLYLIYAGYLIFCMIKGKKNKLKDANLAAIVLFCFTICHTHQSINPAVVIFSFILTTRVLLDINLARKNKADFPEKAHQK